MKQLLLFFAIAALFAACNTQSPEVTPEQLPVNATAGIYGVPVRVDVVRANGATELTNYFSGLANQAFSDYEQANRRYRDTEKYSRATLNTVNARFAALGIPSYFDQQATRLGPALQGEYTWQAPGIATPVAVTVNANLRFNPGTGGASDSHSKRRFYSRFTGRRDAGRVVSGEPALCVV